MKKIISGLLILLLILSGCGKAGQTTSGRTLTDGAGRTVTVPDKVERIVCVGVGALRYSCYLDAADLVVGVEDYEIKQSYDRLYNLVNFEKFRDLPVIGTNGVPNEESILAADPQVIVLSAYASVTAEDLTAKTGLPVVVVPGSDSLLDEKAYKTIEVLGALFGKTEKADSLKAYLQGVQADLKTRTENITERPSVYVCGVNFKGQHGFEGTEANYGPLALLGADNLADTTGQTGAFDIDTEQVLSWDPDVIFADYNGLGLIREDYKKNPEFYNSLTAVQQGKVYAQISFRSFAANLDTALCDAYYAGSVLYPQAFADINLEEKIEEILVTLLSENPYPILKEQGYAFTSVSFGA